MLSRAGRAVAVTWDRHRSYPWPVVMLYTAGVDTRYPRKRCPYFGRQRRDAINLQGPVVHPQSHERGFPAHTAPPGGRGTGWSSNLSLADFKSTKGGGKFSRAYRFHSRRGFRAAAGKPLYSWTLSLASPAGSGRRWSAEKPPPRPRLRDREKRSSHGRAQPQE